MDAQRRSLLRGRWAAAQAAEPAAAMRPPWALRPDDRFTAACTRCGDCVRACPEKVLRIGDGGFPVIDFSHAGCSLCGECRNACTRRAFDGGASAAAFTWRARVDPSCLAQRGVECRVCGDACDAGALKFAPTRGGVARLRIEARACTGCGACVSTCPVQALHLR